MTQMTYDNNTLKTYQILLPQILIKPSEQNQQELQMNNIKFDTYNKISNLEGFEKINIISDNPTLRFQDLQNTNSQSIILNDQNFLEIQNLEVNNLQAPIINQLLEEQLTQNQDISSIQQEQIIQNQQISSIQQEQIIQNQDISQIDFISQLNSFNINTINSEQAVQNTNINQSKSDIINLQNQMNYSVFSIMKQEIENLKNQMNQMNQTVQVPIGFTSYAQRNDLQVNYGQCIFLKLDGRVISNMQTLYPEYYVLNNNSNILPNLTNRFPKQWPGQINQNFGDNSYMIQTTQVPGHTHQMNYNSTGTLENPKGNIWASNGINSGNVGNPNSGEVLAYTGAVFRGYGETQVPIPINPASFSMSFYVRVK